MERRLIATQPTNRFWRASLEGEVIVIRSGPTGTPGAQSRIPCKSPEAAAKTLEALIGQRLRDGFVEEAAAVETGQLLTHEQERELLADDPDRWLVFADQLIERGDAVRGELIGLQAQAAVRKRGSIGKVKDFIRSHYDALVGEELAAFHKQASIEWCFGYAKTIKLWAGPYSVPIPEVIETALNSPASRFLRRLELGSPGGEGSYDAALRELARLEWPAHLTELSLGEFDVNEAFQNESAWPRLDSLASLSKVAARIEVLELRVACNTLGRGLSFPNLRRLSVKPWHLDARVLTDLKTLDAPKLRELSFTPQQLTGVSVEAWASTISRFLVEPGITTLELRRVRSGLEVLELLGERLKGLRQIVLIGSPAYDVGRLRLLVPWLTQARFETPESAALAAALVKLGLNAVGPDEKTLEKQAKQRATRAERARPREDVYDDVVE